MGSLALRSFADGTLFGSHQGQGPARVLYLHGWGRTHRDFDPVRTETALAGSPASLALDLPGFGASPPPPSPGGADLYVRLLLPALAECEQPLILVGHSFGGRVALELAYQRPKAVAALVLTGVPLLRPTVVRSKPSLKFRLMRSANRVGLVSDKTMEDLRGRSGSADYRAAQGVMRDVLVAAVNETYETQLQAVKMPVELVWGDNDTEVFPGIAVRSETMLTNAGLTILPGVGHFVPQEAPKRFAEIIERQLHTIGHGTARPASGAANPANGATRPANSPANNQ